MISVLKKSRPVHYISCTKELLHQTRCLWPHAVTTKLTFGNNTNKKYVNYDFRSDEKEGSFGWLIPQSRRPLHSSGSCGATTITLYSGGYFCSELLDRPERTAPFFSFEIYLTCNAVD